MKIDLRRVVVACVTVGVAAVMVAASSAGPRNPTGVAATFDPLPGPGEVTYGENIAYRATLENKSGTTLTHVIFRQVYPEVLRDGEDPAPLGDPVDSSCGQWGGTASKGTVTVDGVQKQEWRCDLGQRAANAPKITLTIVWNVPVPTDEAEANANCPNCLSSRGYWTVKEGINDNTAPNDTFGGKTVTADLLANKSGSAEKLKAGGYETTPASCGDPEDIDTEAPGSLRTNPALGDDNYVSTTLCFPGFTLTADDRKLGLGFAAMITEPGNNARSADVCIADLGFSCDDLNAPEANFGDDDVIHIFHVAAAGLPNKYVITTVTHNDHELDLCSEPGAEDDPNGCVIQIIPPKGSPKIWIIVAKSPTNGLWGW